MSSSAIFISVRHRDRQERSALTWLPDFRKRTLKVFACLRASDGCGIEPSISERRNEQLCGIPQIECVDSLPPRETVISISS